MRRSFILFALTVCLFTSCNKENEYHQTSIPAPYSLIYADATVDSMAYITTEPHSLSVESNSSWCEVDKTFIQSINEQIRANEGIYQLMAFFNTKPNTTGKMRSAIFHVRDINEGKYNASGLIVQAANLHIIRPEIAISNDLNADSVTTMYLSNLAGTDSITFTTQYPWELTAKESSFIQLSTSNGNAGTHTIHFSFSANPETKVRHTEIILSARYSEAERIVSRIPIIQQKNESTVVQ